ncbi:hypothetical protein P5V15_013267 [Pogonomyrmex californicus]
MAEKMGKIKEKCGDNTDQVTKKKLHEIKTGSIKKNKNSKIKDAEGKINLMKDLKIQNKKNAQKKISNANNQNQNLPEQKHKSDVKQSKHNSTNKNQKSKDKTEKKSADTERSLNDVQIPAYELSNVTYEEDDEEDSDVPDIFGKSLGDDSDEDDKDFEEIEDEDTSDSSSNSNSSSSSSSSNSSSNEDSEMVESENIKLSKDLKSNAKENDNSNKEKTVEFYKGIKMFKGLDSKIKENDDKKDENDDINDEDESDENMETSSDSDLDSDMLEDDGVLRTIEDIHRAHARYLNSKKNDSNNENSKMEKNEDEDQDKVNEDLKIGDTIIDDYDEEDDYDYYFSEDEYDSDHVVGLNHLPENFNDRKNIDENKNLTRNSRMIFVDNIPRNMTEEDLKEIFTKFGIVKVTFVPGFIETAAEQQICKMVKLQQPLKKLSRKAIVTFISEKNAYEALTYNGVLLRGHYLNVLCHPITELRYNDFKKCVSVKNLSKNIDVNSIWRHFCHCGMIQSVHVMRDEKTADCSGEAYVEFTQEVSVPKAMLLNNTEIEENYLINVSHCLFEWLYSTHPEVRQGAAFIDFLLENTREHKEKTEKRKNSSQESATQNVEGKAKKQKTQENDNAKLEEKKSVTFQGQKVELKNKKKKLNKKKKQMAKKLMAKSIKPTNS